MRYSPLLSSFVLLIILSGCTYDSFAPADACTTSIALELATVAPSACGQASGSFIVNGTNREDSNAAVEFSLDGVSFQSSGEFFGLLAGTYTVTAKSGECTGSLTVEVENADGLNAELVVAPSACGDNSGTITIQVRDATGAVSYQLNDGPAQGAADFTGLAPGTYDVKVADEIGCVLELQGVVPSTVVFDDINAIVTASCAISGCHAGNVNPDFRVRDNIVNQANRILARTGAQTMPPPSSGISLSEAEIDAIACWVGDGAPE